MAHEIYLTWCKTAPGQGSADAHRLLGSLYHQVVGEPVPELVREPGGKPCFAQGSWHCSISHTRCAAFCALSRSPLGLDAEPLDRQVGKTVMMRALSSGERAELREFPSETEGFLTHWVLKEAYGKYTGRGLGGNLADLDFQVTGNRARLSGEPLWFGLKRLAGHILALCREEAGEIVLLPVNS